jgi:hypothetical protein
VPLPFRMLNHPQELFELEIGGTPSVIYPRKSLIDNVDFFVMGLTLYRHRPWTCTNRLAQSMPRVVAPT